MKAFFVATILSVASWAQANDLIVYASVSTSDRVEKAISNFAESENLFVTIHKMEVTQRMRCPVCFEVRLTLNGHPRDGRNSVLTKELVVQTQGDVLTHRVQVTNVRLQDVSRQ